MIYQRLSIFAFIAVVLIVLCLIIKREYFMELLALLVICMGFVSFYVFYYLGSYKSTSDDVIMEKEFKEEENGIYSLKVYIKWKSQPQIFGLNGGKDALILRYNPECFEIIDCDRKYEKSAIGVSSVRLSREYKDYKYYNMESSDVEACIKLEDCRDSTTNITLKKLKSGAKAQVFYLHDYKMPLDSQVYWEKEDYVELK